MTLEATQVAFTQYDDKITVMGDFTLVREWNKNSSNMDLTIYKYIIENMPRP